MQCIFTRWWVIALAAGCALAATKPVPTPGEPKIVSVYPFTGQRGTTFSVTIRGTGLHGATAVYLKNAPFTATVQGEDTEAPDAAAKTKTPTDLIRLRIEVEPAAKPGRYPIRLITPRGISDSIPLSVMEQSITDEPAGPHETPETAVSVDKLPAVFNGKIAQRGESDYYAFNAAAGETVTFAVASGLPSTGAPGGNANGFDPSLSLYEQSGSWFDPKRVNRIAFNDEPLWVIGQGTDAYLVHRFEKSGRYLVRIEAFSGQGGPDYGYQLKMLVGETPLEHGGGGKTWAERGYSRHLSDKRLNELAERGGTPKDKTTIETYRATTTPAASAPVFKLPGTLEGGLTQPGETQRARFHLDGPQDIAIEIESPGLAPPLFNPVVRLLNAAGKEVATNVQAGKGACNGEMTKSLQAKTTVPLRDAGDYTVEIRDVTSDLVDPGFRYRVLIRPAVPHVGDVKITEDHVNLTPGEAKTIRVVFEREEDYQGAIAVTTDSLPPGVEALAGADFEPPDKEQKVPVGKRERFTGRTERVVVVFNAAADASAMKQPQIVRLLVRPIVDGKPGAVISTKEIPLMVVAKQ